MNLRVREWREVGRFFGVVRPVPRLTRLTFVVLTGAGLVGLWVAPERSAGALLPVLVFQAFTVSTGFLGDARRGHFDVLFTRGASRMQAGFVYWMWSAVPGVVCWLVLAAGGVVLHRDTSLLASGTVLAVVLVSVLPWSLTVSLTRFAGAVGWLLVIVCLQCVAPNLLPWAGPGHESPAWLAGAAFLFVPIWLVGEDAIVLGRRVLPVVVAVIVALPAALLWIGHVDLPLESGSDR